MLVLWLRNRSTLFLNSFSIKSFDISEFDFHQINEHVVKQKANMDLYTQRYLTLFMMKDEM